MIANLALAIESQQCLYWQLLDDRVEKWHKGDGSGSSLQEFLGFSDVEMSRFVAGDFMIVESNSE